MPTSPPPPPSLSLSQVEIERLVADYHFHYPDDDYSLGLHIAVDEHAEINDFDCYGTIAWGSSRPPGFDGSARILKREQGCALWWMPYREGRVVYDSPEISQEVLTLLEMGFSEVSLQLWGNAVDGLGAPHRVILCEAFIGAIEPTPTVEHLASLCAELLDDLRQQMKDLAVDAALAA